MLKPNTLSNDTLEAIFSNTEDCVKLVDPSGQLIWMNVNGMCAMEIDDFKVVDGKKWSMLWPEDAQSLIEESLNGARNGQTVRFRAFCPTAKGTPKWWEVSVSAVKDVSNNFAGYLSMSRNITEAETARQALEAAAAELRHRIRNTYAVIASLVSGLARGDARLEKFASEINTRLTAMSRAQTIFQHDDVQWVETHELLRGLVQFLENAQTQVRVAADKDLVLNRANADAVALVIGELVVNSNKYGACGFGGAIEITARRAGVRTDIVWHEQSNKPVENTSRVGGQGHMLISRLLKARGGTFQTDWRGDGLTATVSLVDSI